MPHFQRCKSQHKQDRDEEVDSDSGRNIISSADIRKNDTIRFKRTNESEWENAKVVGRAGKATGQFRNWWNIQNSVSGHIDNEDMSCDDLNEGSEKIRRKVIVKIIGVIVIQRFE